jgi:DNA (cytosine-5)-methyltransferase 1
VRTFGSLFAGIGGIDLGLERAGWTPRWQVEIDPFCNRVLAKHWPDVARYGDIRTIDWSGIERVDLLAGGFPCQPVSVAGKQLAQADERWLWPEFARAIRELRPRLVLVENVPGLLGAHGGFGDVLGDLVAFGYDAEWDCIPAAAIGAPHLRYRVYIVAHAHQLNGDCAGSGPSAFRGFRSTTASLLAGDPLSHASPLLGETLEWDEPDGVLPPFPDDDSTGWADATGGSGPQADRGTVTGSDSPQRTLGDSDGPSPDAYAPEGGPRGATSQSGWWLVEPNVGRVAHGVPSRVDRLRSLGNAVVPQVIEVIGRRLLEGWD